MKALIKWQHIFWSLVAHPALYLCLFGGPQGMLQAQSGELFCSWSNSPPLGCWSPTPCSRFSLYMEMQLWPGCIQARRVLVQQGNSKGTQLQGGCGITAVQHNRLRTPIHAQRQQLSPIVHSPCWVTSYHSAPLAPIRLIQRWYKAGQWEWHCFLTSVETARQAQNKPRISLVQP